MNAAHLRLRTERQSWPALLGLAGSLAFAAASAGATTPNENWPQWRGPLQNGVAPAANPPTTWSETNNVKWKVKIPGSGQATPIIWDNRVFIQTAIPTGKKVEAKPAEANEQPPASRPEAGGEPARKGPGRPGGPGGGKGPGGFGGGPKPTEVYQFAVLCLDRQTGKALWQQVAREEVPHEGYRQGEGSFASCSGLYDGKLYFFAVNNGVLSCLDTKAGDPMFEAQRIEDLLGVYASPLGAAGRVYLAGRNGATVVLKQSDKLEVLATNHLDEKFDASPAAVGRDLFLRGREFLYCITEK